MKTTTEITSYEDNHNATSTQPSLMRTLLNNLSPNRSSEINYYSSMNNRFYDQEPFFDSSLSKAKSLGYPHEKEILSGVIGGLFIILGIYITYQIIKYRKKYSNKSANQDKKLDTDAPKEEFKFLIEKDSRNENMDLTTNLSSRPRMITRDPKRRSKNKIQIRATIETQEKTAITSSIAPIAEVEDSSNAAFSKPKSKIEDTNTKELDQSKPPVTVAEATVHQTNITANIPANNKLSIG